jgi:hypothetical protein
MRDEQPSAALMDGGYPYPTFLHTFLTKLHPTTKFQKSLDLILLMADPVHFNRVRITPLKTKLNN